MFQRVHFSRADFLKLISVSDLFDDSGHANCGTCRSSWGAPAGPHNVPTNVLIPGLPLSELCFHLVQHKLEHSSLGGQDMQIILKTI